MLVSFWVLVGILLALRAGGNHLGWGFQLQSPVFVAFLCCFLFLFGLSLAGMFEVGQSFMGAGATLAEKPGYTGSFFTGVLATVVATPCTAPFMGAAVGFALSQPALVCTLVFTTLALGLASPFLLTSRRWAERRFTSVVHWSEPGRGGHFAAWEQPELFVRDIRATAHAVRPVMRQ